MPGTWSTTNPPTRPGAYFNFVSAARQAVTQGVSGTTALVFTADWGPENTVVELNSASEYDSTFSTSTGGTGRDAVYGAFDGFSQGTNRIYAYRNVAAAGVAASVSLTAATATMLLTAKYKGVRPNNSWHVTVQTNVEDGTAKDLILYESGNELERFSKVAGGTVANFMAAINDVTTGSKYVVASTVGGSGALTNVVGVAGGAGGFASGNSGLTPSTNEWNAALTALSYYDFNAIAFGNMTDDTTRDILVSWTKAQNGEGRRFFAVVGGTAAEALSTGGVAGTGNTGMQRADDYDDQNIINVGATDLKRLSDGVVLSTAQLAPRVAGAVAGMGLRRSLTYARLEGYQVNNPLSSQDYTTSIAQGVVTFANDGTSRIRIESGVTALQTTNTTDRHATFQKVRNVAISHYIQNTLTRVANDNYIGQTPNTDTSRRDLVGNFLAFLKILEDQQVLQPGSQVTLDPGYTQTGNAMYVQFGVKYADSIERIFTSVKIG
jgi:hypothetical protein